MTIHCSLLVSLVGNNTENNTALTTTQPEPCSLFSSPSSIQDMDKRLQALLAACEKLPTDNFNNFRSVPISPSLSTVYIDLLIVGMDPPVSICFICLGCCQAEVSSRFRSRISFPSPL